MVFGGFSVIFRAFHSFARFFTVYRIQVFLEFCNVFLRFSMIVTDFQVFATFLRYSVLFRIYQRFSVFYSNIPRFCRVLTIFQGFQVFQGISGVSRFFRVFTDLYWFVRFSYVFLGGFRCFLVIVTDISVTVTDFTEVWMVFRCFITFSGF